MARVEMYGLDANRQPVRKVANSPVGWIGWYPVETPPEGTLVCNGGAVSRTAYVELFAVLGTKYGAGDGSTTFNLPDLRGRFVRGTGGNAAALGVEQGDAIRNITGQLWGRCIQSIGGTSTDYHLLGPVSPTNALYATNGGEANAAEALGTISKVMGGQYIFLDASRVVPTAVENRPVNVALLPCIIYE